MVKKFNKKLYVKKGDLKLAIISTFLSPIFILLGLYMWALVDWNSNNFSVLMGLILIGSAIYFFKSWYFVFNEDD